MELNFYTLSVIYLVYSFLGWVGETVVATAKGRRFTNRGVASGPFCFVYGTAGVLLAVGLADLRSSWFALFAGSFLIASSGSRRSCWNGCTTAAGGIIPIKSLTWTATSACNILPCGVCWAQ